MSSPIIIEANLTFERRGRGAQRLASESKPDEEKLPTGRLAKVTKLMALAIRFEELLADGVVVDYADLARLSFVSRARITQIMNLRLLAPDIQEALLFAPEIRSGRDPISVREMQPIALTANWKHQREMWKDLSDRLGPNVSTSPE